MMNSNTNGYKHNLNTFNYFSQECREQILMILIVAALFIGAGSGFMVGRLMPDKSFMYDRSIKVDSVYTMINSNNNIIYHITE